MMFVPDARAIETLRHVSDDDILGHNEEAYWCETAAETGVRVAEYHLKHSKPAPTSSNNRNSNIIKLRQAFFLECEKEGWPPQWDGVPRVKPCYKGIDKYNDYGNGCLLDDCIVALSQGQKTSPGFAPLIPNALITPSMFMFLLWASTVVRVGE
jgi:hypothetical protein